MKGSLKRGGKEEVQESILMMDSAGNPSRKDLPELDTWRRNGSAAQDSPCCFCFIFVCFVKGEGKQQPFT